MSLQYLSNVTDLIVVVVMKHRGCCGVCRLVPEDMGVRGDLLLLVTGHQQQQRQINRQTHDLLYPGAVSILVVPSQDCSRGCISPGIRIFRI